MLRPRGSRLRKLADNGPGQKTMIYMSHKRDLEVVLYRTRRSDTWVLEALVCRAIGVSSRVGLFRQLDSVSTVELGKEVLGVLQSLPTTDEGLNAVGGDGSPVDAESQHVFDSWPEIHSLSRPSKTFRRFSIVQVRQRPGQTSWFVYQVIKSRYAGCTEEVAAEGR